jgi:hypothetical protein
MKRALFIRSLVLVVGLLVAGSASAAIFWDSAEGGNNHYYQLVVNSADWNTANANAQESVYDSMSGHLATITSAEENDWVYDNVVGDYMSTNKNEENSIWLGATDEDTEGTWAWVTGEAWEYTNWDAPTEPNGATGENYLAFNWNILEKWNDADGTRAFAYIVEYETAPVPEPATMLLMGAGLAGLLVGALGKKNV